MPFKMQLDGRLGVSLASNSIEYWIFLSFSLNIVAFRNTMSGNAFLFSFFDKVTRTLDSILSFRHRIVPELTA